MSTLREKYEESRRRAYRPREPIARRNNYNEINGTRFVPRVRSPISSTSLKRPLSPIRSLDTLPFTPSKLKAPIGIYRHTGTRRSKIDGGILLKSNRSKRQMPVSVLQSQKKGVLQRLGQFFLRLCGNDSIGNEEEINEGIQKKKVWFEDKDKNLEIEREHTERLKKTYEEELRKLEDELDEKEMEVNTTREQLRLQEVEQEKRVQDLESSFIRDHEARLAEQRDKENQLQQDRQRLEQLEEKIRIQQKELRERTERVEKERKILIEQQTDIENKQRKFLELDRRRFEMLRKIRNERSRVKSIERERESESEMYNDFVTPIRSKRPVLSELDPSNSFANTSSFEKFKSDTSNILVREKHELIKEFEENENQRVKFFETVTNISTSVTAKQSNNNDKLLSNLEQLLKNLDKNSKLQSRTQNYKSIETKLNEYLIMFENSKHSRNENRTALESLFNKLEKNLSITFEKRKNGVKELNHEIFNINLMLADPETASRVVTNESSTCVRFLAYYERKGLLLGEMIKINRILIMLEYLNQLIRKKEDYLGLKDLELITTSTPRYMDEGYERPFSLSPIDVSGYFVDMPST